MSHPAARNLKLTVALAVLGCAVVSGYGAMSTPGDAQTERTAAVFVNRTNKGDRLPSVAAAKLHSNGAAPTTAFSPQPARPPLGCDPAFSPMSVPRPVNIYRRCVV